MSAVLTPHPLPSAPRPQARLEPVRWTVTEYRDLGRLGLLSGRKTILLHGEIFAVPMPSPPHDVALGHAEDWLRVTFAVGHHVRCQMGFDVGTDSDPGPDLAVVTGIRKDYVTAMPTTAVLIVEVASSSLATDTTTKAELYATAGVPEYWVVDVDNRKLHVFRDPAPLPAGLGATAYRTHFTLADTDAVAPLVLPSATVPIADLLP